MAVPCSNSIDCRRRAGIVCTGFFVWGLAFPAGHAAASQARDRLEAIEQKIGGLRQSLETDRNEYQKLQERLARIEQRIAELDQAHEELELSLRAQRDKAARLRRRQQLLSQRYNRQRRLLERQFKAQFILMRQGGRLGLMFADKDDVPLGRLVDEYGYLQRGLATALAKTRRSRTRLAMLERDIDETGRRIKALIEQREADRRQWQQQRQQRQVLLARLGGAIAGKQHALEEALKAQQRLQGLIGKLEARSRIEGQSSPGQAFDRQKGILPWPVKGRIVAQFGRRRSKLGPRWQGITIAGRRGSPVEAVFAGRVVFADWLRGYGQLIIIDHGDGYLTLYGHNEGLLKRRGDPVAQGEAIARVGDTGGQSLSGVYFEIRHLGRPVNPMTWLEGASG